MSSELRRHVGAQSRSPTLSTLTFAPSNILPETTQSSEGIGVTKQEESVDQQMEIGSHMVPSPSLLDDAFNLDPPPPRASHADPVIIADRLFSLEHLDLILKNRSICQRFTAFLNRYRPQYTPTLTRYLDSQKALAAIRYANSVADRMSMSCQSLKRESGVADPLLNTIAQKALEELASEALPAYITHRLVDIVTDVLVKEITGNNIPLMRDMVQGLAEVYCMTDPTLPDNPIIFASQEFHSATQYGQEYVIGKNCRFLQGPNTCRKAIRRISDALHRGEEISEIVLNYRRDGSPFLNLVMMAPLMDARGIVRYFIGCQIDISHLIEGGRGLESFKQLLDQEDLDDDKPLPDSMRSKPSLKVLRELGGLLDDEEIEAMRDVNAAHHDAKMSLDSEQSTSIRAPHAARRYIDTDETGLFEEHPRPPTQFALSGKLPGVYQSYLLIRPYPSLKVVFTSPSLRIPGLSQSYFMDRIGGPQNVREGLMDALSRGIGVTAKVSWVTHAPSRPPDDTGSQKWGKGRPVIPHLHLHPPDGQTSSSSSVANSEISSSFNSTSELEGRPRWIHCTPLLGSDSKPGVWMVVMVDNDDTGALNVGAGDTPMISGREAQLDGLSPAIAGMRLDDARFTSAKLFEEYLIREGYAKDEAEPEDRKRR